MYGRVWWTVNCRLNLALSLHVKSQLLALIYNTQLVVILCRLGVNYSQSIFDLLPGLSAKKSLKAATVRCYTPHLHLFEPLKCFLPPPPAFLFTLLSTTTTLVWWKCSVCANTHIMHTQCPLALRQHHKAGTTETATVGWSWRQGRKTVLKLDLELLDELEHFKKSFSFPLNLSENKKKSPYPSLDKYFNHGISSSHRHEVIWNLLPFLTYVLAVKQHCMPERLSAPLVCGFLSKFAKPYGKKQQLHFSAGNKPVKHITLSCSVCLWRYTVAQDVVSVDPV